MAHFYSEMKDSVLKRLLTTAQTLSAVGLCSLSFSFPTQAVSLTYYPQWNSGGIAGTCYFNLPELAPLSVPKTLIVDNHLPTGTEIYSWGYNEFVPNIKGYCDPGGTNTVGGSARFLFLPSGTQSVGPGGAFATNIPGIGLKIYFIYTEKAVSTFHSSADTTYLVSNSGGWISPTEPLNVEYSMSGIGNAAGVRFNADYYDNDPPRAYLFTPKSNRVSFSIRAALVKTGTVTYSGTALSPLNTAMFGSPDVGGYTAVPNVIGGGGIRIIPPACRLKTPTNHSVDMGRWTHSGPGSHQPGISLPAYGAAKTINISLECSGSLDNVYFRFEDAGTAPLANKNVSLYDGGGTKIEGLEIEMQYGGNRIDVDNTTNTDVGPHGAQKTNAQDLSFNSQSIIPFTARYVQRNAIKKGGVSYTGQVAGKVNMYVTYQ